MFQAHLQTEKDAQREDQKTEGWVKWQNEMIPTANSLGQNCKWEFYPREERVTSSSQVGGKKNINTTMDK